jgi:hypothetical protein
VLESFAASYGEDGTIFGLPDTSVQLEILRSTEPAVRVHPHQHQAARRPRRPCR